MPTAPAFLEDCRQAKWDSRLAALPVCDSCGEPIAAPTRFWFAKQDLYFCPHCVSRMEEPNEPISFEEDN